MRRRRLVLTLAMIFLCGSVPSTSITEAKQVSESVASIEQEYREALQVAEKSSDGQIAAELRKRKKFSLLAHKYYEQLDAIESAPELFSLASAFEAAGHPNRAQEVNNRLLSMQPAHQRGCALRIRHKMNHASAEEGLAAIQETTKLLTAKDMTSLLPYWGVLGFKFASERQPRKALRCFTRYLDYRYDVAKSSAEPLPVIPKILRKMREQYLRLKDRTEYLQQLDLCQNRLNQAAEVWRSQPESNDESLAWQLRFLVVEIFLAEERQGENPLIKYQQFIDLAIEHADFVIEAEFFSQVLDEATRTALNGSHRWQDLSAYCDWCDELVIDSDSTLHKTLTSSRRRNFQKLVREAVLQTQRHAESMVQAQKTVEQWAIPDFAKSNDMTARAEMGEHVPYVLCLSQNPAGHLYKIRSHLADLALQHPVVVCFETSKEEATLRRQLRMLPKPIHLAKTSFQIRFLSWPSQWEKALLPDDGVLWLIVRDKKIRSQFVGSSEEKVAEIRWQLSCAAD